MPIADFSRVFMEQRILVVPEDVRIDVVYSVHCCHTERVSPCDVGANVMLVEKYGPFWIGFSSAGGQAVHWRGPFVDRAAAERTLALVLEIQATKQRLHPCV